MKRTGFFRCVRGLSGLIFPAVVLDVLALPLAPGLAALLAEEGPGALEELGRYLAERAGGGYGLHNFGHAAAFFLLCWRWVWLDGRTAGMTLLLLIGGIGAAVLLMKLRKWLDTHVFL